VRPSLKPDLAYDAQEVMRLSRVLSASDLRAHNDTAHSSVKAKDRVGQNHQGASHNSNALFARRGVIGNVLSASIDSTRASVQYGIPETLLRNAGMNTLAHVLEQGRLKQEHAADAKLSYARDHQGAVIDWADVRGPWSFSKYTGTLLVQSVLPMGAAIAGSAAGAAAGPALGITSAMGLLGVRAASTTLSLYPFSVGANLDAQRSGGAHIGKAATLAVPHAAVSSLLGPVAAVSGLMRAAGRAGLPAPSGVVDAMLLTGAGGAASQIGQGLIERSGVNRQNEVFWDPAFLSELENRTRDGGLLGLLFGSMASNRNRTIRASAKEESLQSIQLEITGQSNTYRAFIQGDPNFVVRIKDNGNGIIILEQIARGQLPSGSGAKAAAHMMKTLTFIPSRQFRVSPIFEKTTLDTYIRGGAPEGSKLGDVAKRVLQELGIKPNTFRWETERRADFESLSIVVDIHASSSNTTP